MRENFLQSHILSSVLGYGPITHKNESNKNEFITAMEALQIIGGGDCPELASRGCSRRTKPILSPDHRCSFSQMQALVMIPHKMLRT